MKSKLRKPPKPTAADFLREGNASFRAGRFFLAAKAFEKARDLEPRNAAILFNLASAKERVGEIAEAAVLLTQAARQRPSWPEPAQRLAQLLGQYKLETPGDLDPHGLLACFAFDRLDRRIVAAATADYLRATTTLEKAIRDALAGDPDEAARSMILRRTDAVLSDRLLLATLAAGPVTDIGLETLLTAIRRIVLLEVTPERFEDKAFTAFLLALIRQSMANDYIFAVSDAEAAKLRELVADPQTFRADDAEQIRRLMLRLLYETPDAAGLPDMSVDDCRKIRPRGLGELLAEWQGERIRIAALAKDIPSIGAISNTVSKKVAGQYEAHPYPRWDSLQMPEESSASVSLRRYFPDDRLAFMDKPFKVLVAGCGTGQQAIAAAVRYGPKADVHAIDLSKASLAYAKARAEDFGLVNLRFAQADILDFADSGEGPFNIIEAVGVLHHMEKPSEGWRILAEQLRPGGLMLIGLYSVVSRRHLTELRNRSDYPGSGCDIEAARQYRAALIAKRDEMAVRMTASLDFYSMNEFRDLLLHEHEQPMLLSEIEALLEDNKLTFRGFQLPSPIIAHFLQNSPGESWPGSFRAWASYEAKFPRTFDVMYNFWCEKAG